MSVCPIPDYQIEVLFSKLRASLLLNISLLNTSPEVLNFLSALALHCFTNEYIYYPTKDEQKGVKELETSVKNEIINKKQPNPETVLILASYKALNQYDWSDLLVVTNEIRDVFIRQVKESKKEKLLKSQIPTIKKISDDVSSKVRQQYEENPYPRWVHLKLPLTPMSISEAVKGFNLKVFSENVMKVEEPEILIAGCGTGQHSIETAAIIKASKVLAIDLSLSSLSYAKRKTEELGINNIEYMQADILDLLKLNKTFDIIESSGVLHHMENPIAGWKVLTACLKPGGFMRIGLYSKSARQYVSKIREEIKISGKQANRKEMSSIRKMILNSKKTHHKWILNYADFYSFNELRDLLFHVKEHHFTIPQIDHYLSDLNLKFCGFETPNIISNFKKFYTKKEDLYDLNKWLLFEKANPFCFAGMYQFWCQKVN